MFYKYFQMEKKNKIIFLLIFIIFCKNSFSQTKSDIVILKAINKDGYSFFTENSLEDSVTGILLQPDNSKYISPKKRPITFYWNSNCNDGSYYLTVTPEQIYFTSGHNNPNPNFLYWFIKIDTSQYLEIKKGLTKKTPKGFSKNKYTKERSLDFFQDNYIDKYEIPENWTKKEQDEMQNHCDSQIISQLTKYFEIINLTIFAKSNKIEMPSNELINKIKPKYLSSIRQEIIGWAPKKRGEIKKLSK